MRRCQRQDGAPRWQEADANLSVFGYLGVWHMSERKTALTQEEMITAAYFHYVRKLDQQDIAQLYGVNQGRVNEACKVIAEAVGMRPKVNIVPKVPA
jgi:hypothetical protein